MNVGAPFEAYTQSPKAVHPSVGTLDYPANLAQSGTMCVKGSPIFPSGDYWLPTDTMWLAASGNRCRDGYGMQQFAILVVV